MGQRLICCHCYPCFLAWPSPPTFVLLFSPSLVDIPVAQPVVQVTLNKHDLHAATRNFIEPPPPFFISEAEWRLDRRTHVELSFAIAGVLAIKGLN